jgi:hypothetical protein
VKAAARLLCVGAMAYGALGLGGCAAVAPWERALLAKRKMQMNPDPLATQLEQHVYEYREGASGGYGSVGGGCGCN